jgi:hypothetical protein
LKCSVAPLHSMVRKDRVWIVGMCPQTTGSQVNIFHF